MSWDGIRHDHNCIKRRQGLVSPFQIRCACFQQQQVYLGELLHIHVGVSWGTLIERVFPMNGVCILDASSSGLDSSRDIQLDG